MKLNILMEAEYKGYKYMTIAYIGTINGYVEIPKDNPLHGKHYDEIDIKCHGGLTFSGEMGDFEYCIGFDTNHLGDAKSTNPKHYEKESDMDINNYFKYFPNDDTFKDEEYVENECKKIINQILEMK